jgi:membrane protease YdiL (CAAX protease family)
MKKSQIIYPNLKQAILFTILWICFHALVYLFGSYLMHTFQFDIMLSKSLIYLLGSLSAIPIISFTLRNIKKNGENFTSRKDLFFPGFYSFGKLTILTISLFMASMPLSNPLNFFKSIVNGNIDVINLNRIDLSLPVFFSLIHCAILGPILEELFFRGILLNQFSKRYSRLKALFISSLLFTGAHFRLEGILILFLSGMVFGHIYLKSKSIISSITAHCLLNIFIFNSTTQMQNLNSFNFIQLLVSIASLGIIISAIFYPKFRPFSSKVNAKITEIDSNQENPT